MIHNEGSGVLDFEFSDDGSLLKQDIREFIDNEVEPHVLLIIEESDDIPRKSKEIGLYALSVPESYDGLGIDMVGKSVMRHSCISHIKENLGVKDRGIELWILTLRGKIF